MSTQTAKVTTLGQYTGLLRRRWRYVAVISPLVVLIALGFAFLLPAVYSSSATILLEQSSIDSSLVKTTVVSYADQRIELVRRDVMTPAKLEQIVRQNDPYPERTDLSMRDKAILLSEDTSITKVDPVTLQPMAVSSAFSIKYSNRSPRVAATVAQELADMFLTANRETRTAQAADTYRFMLAKSNELEGQIRQVDQRLAEFKSRYGNALPEAMQRNETGLDRSQRELDEARAQIRLVEQQESLLKLQLNQISPTLITAKGGDIFTQLGLLRAQLAEAQQKYTPDHPDVKRLTRAIDALAAQAKLGNPDNVRPDNPDYLRVSAELTGVRNTLAALRANVTRSQVQIDEYQRWISQTPQIEQGYVQLTREREVLQQQFEQAQSKLRDADLSRSLESEAKGERYTQIRQPGISSQPDSPNRIGIVMLGLLLGFGLGSGVAIVKESSDPTVRSSVDIADITDIPILAAIPNLRAVGARRREYLVWGMVAGAYTLAAAILGLYILLKGRWA